MPASSPIALFAYKRPRHLERVVDSLRACPEFLTSELFVFADGAKGERDRAGVEAVRAYLRRLGHPRLRIAEASGNRGLAASVIAGVSELCESHGRVIVLEDDLVVAPCFLTYMNAALERYADEPRVMQVSAHVYGAIRPREADHAFLSPLTTSWGWATWRRAWLLFDPDARGWEQLISNRVARQRFNLLPSVDYASMLCRQMQGKLDSWAIRWYWSVYRNDGLTVFPPRSLTHNTGFDGSGTHRSWREWFRTRRRGAMPEQMPTLPSLTDVRNAGTLSTASPSDAQDRNLKCAV